MRLADRRLPKCSTACSQSSADRLRRSRIDGAFFGIAPRFPGFNWRPVQSSNCRYSASAMNMQPLFEVRRLEHFSRAFFRFGSNSTGASQPAFWPCSIRTSFASAVETSSADFCQSCLDGPIVIRGPEGRHINPKAIIGCARLQPSTEHIRHRVYPGGLWASAPPKLPPKV